MSVVDIWIRGYLMNFQKPTFTCLIRRAFITLFSARKWQAFQLISSFSILRQLKYLGTPTVWSTVFQFFRKFHLLDKHNLNINTSIYFFSAVLFKLNESGCSF